MFPWSAIEIVRSVNDGTRDPREAVEHALTAIAAGNEALNAIVDFDPAEVEPQLAELARRLAAGERPPLAGVPVATKDHIRIAGKRVTLGSLMFRDFVPEHDDVAIERLRAAGAIFVGSTNMSEFGCTGHTSNLVYGTTRHPQDPRLTPGGSSGGAAAALGAGFVPLALGSDGAGSGRRPAAHCGVVGFKPSTGAIATPRILSPTEVLAPMAARVDDVTLFFNVLAGSHPEDPGSVDLPADDGRPVRALRIAYSPRFGLDVPVDPDVATAIEAAVEKLRAAGLSIEQSDPLWPEGASEAGIAPIQQAGLAAGWGDAWRVDPTRFSPAIAAQIERGLALDGLALARAYGLSQAIAGAAARFFARGYDLLIGPTTPCVAWPHEHFAPREIDRVRVGDRGHAVFTPFFNHAFCPALSLPAGRGRNDLPVGLQIAGRRLSDRQLLRAAAFMEDTLSDRQK
ncbi:amidase [Ancylobacter amanitiformis]|uniref:Aspartyl-tRNA(Asn)/glutamyl-tRNA(Gln) amidotransferase subunit A n=1 Tax=Ancylobacter amanitiformis TaxID=217069 RepID=A0ABU0LW42_9HYPH|nr:amidase [Ancylobacter amanitiformis]MDQ0512894.1 aspartyl-tRNA(Asn)/glutamyl-tRNA(Gln) amidotransferase subunit A [Ancylobacter amanitiformis]